MPIPYSRARLDRSLIKRGEDAVLRRRVGTSAVFVEVGVRIHFRGYKPDELTGGIQQGDSVAILSPTQILAAGAAWPGAAGGVQMPRANDGLTVQGRLRNVQAVSVIYEAAEPVRIELQVRG